MSELSNYFRMALIVIHELWEFFLIHRRKISIQSIDDYDMEFENNRRPDDKSEPGDQPDCPYRREHLSASGVEKILASELNLSWHNYSSELDALSFPSK